MFPDSCDRPEPIAAELGVEENPVRNFLAFIGLLFVVFVMVGYNRDWFTFSVDSDKNFNLKGNGSKVIKDVKEGAEIGVDKSKDFLDNLKKDKDGNPISTPTPAGTAGPSGK
jgi:hypothetical protein